MRILILSVTAGEGHNSTALALKERFTKRGVNCDILDTLKYINKVLGKTVDTGYLATTKNFQASYARVYKILENRKTVRDEYSLARVNSSLAAKKIYKFILAYSPDAIISTHCFTAMILDVINERFGLDMPTYGVVTDFSFHPFWEEATNLDHIVTANELLNVQALKKGFIRKQIAPLGIPIKSKFAVKGEKTALRKKYDLVPDRFTILLMSGSMGFGNIEKTVQLLENVELELQLIIVCGKNENAKNAIDSMKHRKKVLCLGFVDYIDELMDCADCFISKPGGLTTSEALAKELPLIIINPIPGVEDRNTEFLTNNGVAMRVTSTCPLDEVIYQCFYFPEKLENMRRNIRLIKRPDSAEALCTHVLNKIDERTSCEAEKYKDSEQLRVSNRGFIRDRQTDRH